MTTTELSRSESLAAVNPHSARGWFAALVLLLVCGSARGQVQREHARGWRVQSRAEGSHLPVHRMPLTKHLPSGGNRDLIRP